MIRSELKNLLDELRLFLCDWMIMKAIRLAPRGHTDTQDMMIALSFMYQRRMNKISKKQKGGTS